MVYNVFMFMCVGHVYQMSTVEDIWADKEYINGWTLKTMK